MPICFVFSGNGCAETSYEKHAYQWLPSRFTETVLILPLTGRCNQSVGRCLIGLDALMPQTVVENACVCVLAITAAVPRGTPRIHIRKWVAMPGSILRWHLRFGRQTPGAAVFF